jgi:uncharacterized protein YjbJ (UPF0337 family)
MAGEIDDAKGRAKEAVGSLKDDDDLKAEGKVDRATGAVKDKAEDAKEKVGEIADKIRNKVT